MIKSILPSLMKEVILHDAIQRDITTARRASLLEILWNERYLTRSQLITRVELRLGKNCFGVSAWEDTFYRGQDNRMTLRNLPKFVNRRSELDLLEKYYKSGWAEPVAL